MISWKYTQQASRNVSSMHLPMNVWLLCYRHSMSLRKSHLTWKLFFSLLLFYSLIFTTNNLLIFLFFVSLENTTHQLYLSNLCILLKNLYHIQKNGNLKVFGIVIKVALMSIVLRYTFLMIVQYWVMYNWKIVRLDNKKVRGGIRNNHGRYLEWQIFMRGRLRKWRKYLQFL
jgi:hypothetical protein